MQKKKVKPKNKKKTIEKPLTYIDGQLYPKLFFKETFWTKLLKFLGLKP